MNERSIFLSPTNYKVKVAFKIKLWTRPLAFDLCENILPSVKNKLTSALYRIYVSMFCSILNVYFLTKYALDKCSEKASVSLYTIDLSPHIDTLMYLLNVKNK